MIGARPQPLQSIVAAIQWLAMLAGIALHFSSTRASDIAEGATFRPRLAAALGVCLFLCLTLMNSTVITGFIYRQF
jgi:hypothetical protein